MERRASLASLPNELLLHILSYHSLSELLRNCRYVSRKWYWLVSSPDSFLLDAQLAQHFDRHQVNLLLSAHRSASTLIGSQLSEVFLSTYQFNATSFDLVRGGRVKYRRLALLCSRSTSPIRQAPLVTTRRNRLLHGDNETILNAYKTRPFVIRCYPSVDTSNNHRKIHLTERYLNFGQLLTTPQLEIVQTLKPWLKLSFDNLNNSKTRPARDRFLVLITCKDGDFKTLAHRIFLDPSGGCVFLADYPATLRYLAINGFNFDDDISMKLTMIPPKSDREKLKEATFIHADVSPEISISFTLLELSPRMPEN